MYYFDKRWPVLHPSWLTSTSRLPFPSSQFAIVVSLLRHRLVTRETRDRLPGGTRDPYGSQLWTQRVPRTLPADPKNLLETRKNRMHVRVTIGNCSFGSLSLSKFFAYGATARPAERTWVFLGQAHSRALRSAAGPCGACPSQSYPLLYTEMGSGAEPGRSGNFRILLVELLEKTFGEEVRRG